MEYLRDLDNLPESIRGCALSIGNFDGVHRGHVCIVRRLVSLANALRVPSVVLTFDPHPIRILRPEHAPLPLTEPDVKARLLRQLGVDAVVVCNTTRELLNLEATEFFQRIVRNRFDARALVEGANFLFGRNRTGNVELLRNWCTQAGIILDVVPPLEEGGHVVSSSRIRALIAAGMVDAAGRLLGRPYSIRGTVVRGAGRGKKLGFPTANLGNIETMLPSEGVYAAQTLLDGKIYPVALAIGPNKTFDETTLKVEAHISGFSGDLYGKQLVVELLARVSAIRKFSSVDQLIEHMRRMNEQACRLVQEKLADTCPSSQQSQSQWPKAG